MVSRLFPHFGGPVPLQISLSILFQVSLKLEGSSANSAAGSSEISWGSFQHCSTIILLWQLFMGWIFWEKLTVWSLRVSSWYFLLQKISWFTLNSSARTQLPELKSVSWILLCFYLHIWCSALILISSHLGIYSGLWDVYKVHWIS